MWHFKILQIAVRNVCFTTKTVMTKSLQIQAVLSHESAWKEPKHFEVHAMFNWYGATKNLLATVTDPKLPLVDLQHPGRILAWDSKLPGSTSHNKSMQPIQWISWSRIEGQNPSSHSSWTDSVHSTHYGSHSLCFNRLVSHQDYQSHPKSGFNHAWVILLAASPWALNPNSRYIYSTDEGNSAPIDVVLYVLVLFGRIPSVGGILSDGQGFLNKWLMTFSSSATKSSQSLPPLHTWVMRVQPSPSLRTKTLHCQSWHVLTTPLWMKATWKHQILDDIQRSSEDPYWLQIFLSCQSLCYFNYNWFQVKLQRKTWRIHQLIRDAPNQEANWQVWWM